jgi:hypothetical protein
MKPIALLVVVALAACKGSSDEKAKPMPASASAPAPKPPAAPFTGALTIDRVMGARDLVKPFDAWDDGFARLQAQLGPPTKIDGARHTWAVVDGDACAYVYVTKDNGADYSVEGIIVGTVQTPARTTKGGTTGDHNTCLKAAGVDVGPPEDPAAPGPPADGAAVPIAAFRTAVIPARSKWKDQKVKVAAVLGSISTSTSGTDRFTTASLITGPDDKNAPLSCRLTKNQVVPPSLKQGTPVIAEGTVAIQEWTSGGGSTDVTLEAALADCTLAAAK